MAPTPSEPKKLPCLSCKSTNNESVLSGLQFCKTCGCLWGGGLVLRNFASFSGLRISYYYSSSSYSTSSAFACNFRVHSTPATSTPTSAAASSFSSDVTNINNNNIAHESLHGNPVLVSMLPQMGSWSGLMTGSLMGCGMKVMSMEGSMEPPGEGNYAYLPEHMTRKSDGDHSSQLVKDYSFEGNNSTVRLELIPDRPQIEQVDFQNPAIGGTSHLHSNIRPTSSGPHPTVVVLGPNSPIIHPTSNPTIVILGPDSPIVHPTSNGPHPTVVILGPDSPIIHLTSNGPRPTVVVPPPNENKSGIESNNAILGMIGQVALAMLLSSQSDSTSMRVFVAATIIGFLGSFFANYAHKNPK